MVEPIRTAVPFSPQAAEKLRAGDFVLLSGTFVTGRDRIHRCLAEQRPTREEIPFDLSGAVMYHCGPVVRREADGFSVVAAGPTTSMRVESYAADVLKQYGIRGMLGKGGMGRKTLEALKETGSVYLHTIGGAAVYLADRITGTRGVWKLEEYGPTEAMWLLDVKDFPAIVTMDSVGNSLHQEIEDRSFLRFLELTGLRKPPVSPG